jgi:O-antigen/teichoic acid export membrane protein
MNPIKQLFGQTAVYGMGIVLPRLLNFVILTPFYTRRFDTGEYGIITELYAYVVLLLIVLTYGMETGFFRFASNSEKKNTIYTSILLSVFSTSLLFLVLIRILLEPISGWLQYGGNPEYILWLAIIVAVDAFTAIPFARIRLYNRAKKYAVIRIIEISVNIGLNLFFIKYCRDHYETVGWVSKIYDPSIGVGYVLISNLVSSLLKMVLLSSEIFAFIKGKFDLQLFRQVLKYSYPLLIAGLAGAVNEALDRTLLKHLLDPASDPMGQLGIYGANYKIAVLMTLYVQAFRYAAEPFFFSKSGEKDAKILYADVMKYYLIPGLLIFLVVNVYLEYFKLFIGPEFREGVHIVPIVLMANLLIGIFFNLSIWYKLENKTMIGAILVIIGALITVFINIAFIPRFGYLASAWGHLVCYSVMITISYLWSRKHFHIHYDFRKILIYFITIVGFFYVDRLLTLRDLSVTNYLKPVWIIAALVIFYLGEKDTFRKYTKQVN